MSSYTFEPSSPHSQPRAAALPHPSASFSGLPPTQDESLQGAVPYQPSSGILPQPRSYRTLADAARALAEASSASLNSSYMNTSASGTASPANSTHSQIQQRLLQIQQQQQQQQQPPPYQTQPQAYGRPPDWRIHVHGIGPNSLPVLVSDDVVSGTKRNGWMSPVRRFFCLLVTFDVILTTLMWVITVIITGRDLRTAIEQQILDYTISSSMFDCVVVAAVRFLVSILFYAALDVNHWLPVSVTTLLTSAFTVAKVFVYNVRSNEYISSKCNLL